MKKISSSLVLSILPFCAFANVFKTDITVTNPGDAPERRTFNFDAATDFFDQVSNSGFDRSFTSYTNKAEVIAKTLYNGVPINILMESNSTRLTLEIPDIGVKRVFTGATRSKSTKALEDYLRRDRDGTASKIERFRVGNTATSALAGNPTSLGGTLVSGNFNNFGASLPKSGASASSAAGGTKRSVSNNPFAVGVGGGTYVQNNTDVSIISVPVSKAFAVDSSDSRKKLLVNGQFNYVTVGEASSFQGSFGLGYMHPINDNWYLVPSVSYGALGSVDLASLGQIFSTSLASNYEFKVSDYTLTAVNMFGYYKTLPLNVRSINSDPDIENYVLKNGIYVGRELPFQVFNHRLNVKGIFTDTEFFGSKVFTRQYNEVGIEINTLEKVKWLDTVTFGMADALTLSAKYVFSIENPNRLEGYDIGIGYDF